MRSIYLAALFCLACWSCSNFLQEYSQDQSYVRSYKDLDELLIGETYMETDFGYEIGYFPYLQIMADETRENVVTTWEQPDWDQLVKKYFGYVTWQYRAGYAPGKLTTSAEDTYWNKVYKHINLANMILDEIDKQAAPMEEDRQAVARIRGEAYFLRAAYYFMMVNLYSQPYEAAKATEALGVPLKTTHYIEDRIFPRAPQSEVYALILDDLEKAAANLTDIPRKSLYRANITAVRLLQSRVYLYMQNWEKAAEYAQLCLDLQSDLADMNAFNSNRGFVDRESPEVIFSMGGNNIPQMLSGLFAGLSVSEGLQKMYQNGDLRKEYYITYVGGDNEVWDCNKYVLQGSTQNANVSEIYVLRTAEAWLNLAEAEACMGGAHEENARKALDELRKRRIMRNNWQATTLAGDALIQEIRNERRRELCFEGHRWFDLRRYTVCEKVPFTGAIQNTYSTLEDMYTISTISTYELSAGDPSWTLQIPYEVLQYEELTPNPRNERAPISVKNGNQIY